MRIDAHLHCWNRLHGRIGREEVVEPLGGGRLRIRGREVRGMPAELLDGLATAEHALAVFDAHGVDAGVLVQEYLDGEQNAYSLELAQRHPGRFFVYGLPDFFQSAAELAAQCHALLDQGFRGLKYCGGALRGETALDDPALMPIHERLQKEEGFWSWDLCEGEEQVPAAERVLAEFPALRAAIGHFGMPTRGGWPGQLMLARHPHVRIETGGIVWLYRDEGWPFARAQAAIAHARDLIGAEKLMWGSDWPRTMCDFSYAEAMGFLSESPMFTAREKAQIMGDNAAAFYSFPAPERAREPLPPITALG
ncbi:MAG: amidohydrolase family protein [Planctomycetota bacterium]|nr:amidohydrolase family protein [Planctomycetota bacterium]